MNRLKVPAWVYLRQHHYDKIDQVPEAVFDEINERLSTVQSEQPLVSIIIAAWNEEINILNCVSSLSYTVSTIPFEIIVVDNNSTDGTSETLAKLKTRSLFQPIQGCGPARQLGQEKAKGKYILLADADCLYPACWVDEMMKVLMEKGVVCVYGRYSFISERGYPRWQLYLLETMKDVIAEFRHINRPYLNAYGISMGYIKELGLKVGYVTYKIWGDDGRLCFDLMKYGKVQQVKVNKARAWTSPRTLQRDGSFKQALLGRIRKEIKRFFSLFKPHPPHDTKTSQN